MAGSQAHATLIIDIGTHAVRSAVVSLAGAILSSYYQPISLNRLSRQQVEQSGDEIVASVSQVIALALSGHKNIVNAGLTIQRSTVIAWESLRGLALYPALSWQDTRMSASVFKLANPVPIQNLSGLRVSPHYGASKIKWLHDTLPSEGHREVTPLVSFVLFHLLNDNGVVCDESNASRTQLYDIYRRQWSAQLCDIFHVDKNTLPTVRPCCHAFGKLKNDAIPLNLVLGDQNAAYLYLSRLAESLNLEKSYGVFINVGSGAFVMSELDDKALYDFNLNTLLTSLVYSDEGGASYCLEGTVNGAGIVIEKKKDVWNKKYGISEKTFYKQINEWFESNYLDNIDIPIFLNAEGGLGSPFWLPHIESYWLDTGKDNDNVEHVIAVIESIVFLIVLNIIEIQKQKPSIAYLMMGGGMSQLSGFCQLVSDVAKLPVYVTHEKEVTVLGAACLLNKKLVMHDGVKDCLTPNNNTSVLKRFEVFQQEIATLVHD